MPGLLRIPAEGLRGVALHVLAASTVDPIRCLDILVAGEIGDDLEGHAGWDALAHEAVTKTIRCRGSLPGLQVCKSWPRRVW